MSKLKSLDELKKIREKSLANTDIRTTGDNANRTVIAIGMSTCGIAAGARKVMSAIIDELGAKDVKDVSVVATGCLGFCYAEPLVEIRTPDGEPIRYANVDEHLAKEIVDQHICKGIFLEEHLFTKGVPKSE